MSIEIIGAEKAEALKKIGALVRNGEYCVYANNPADVKDDVILLRTFGAAHVGLPDLIYPIMVDDMCDTCRIAMTTVALILNKVLEQMILQGAQWDPKRHDNFIGMYASLLDFNVLLEAREVPSSALADDRWADQCVFEMSEGVYSRANIKDPMVGRYAQLTIADFEGRFPMDSGYIGMSFIGPVPVKGPGVILFNNKASVQ